jgi:hypothetical protein
MRLLAIAALSGLLMTAAHADTIGRCAAAWQLKTPETAGSKTYKDWSAVCLKSDYKTAAGTPAAPPPNVPLAPAAPPAGATAQCKDGSYSMSKTALGRCSGHGGVAKML